MTAASLRRLTLTNFRSYHAASLDIEANLVVLTGPNGAGKTNLIEAISFLMPGRGLRRATLEEVAFSEGDGTGTRNDFLGVGVKSFGATRDSHLAFFDLSQGRWETYFGQSASAKAGYKDRLERFYCERKRPESEKARAMLAEAKQKLPPSIQTKGKVALQQVRGVTRTDRHQEVAERLFRVKR